jgi:hypothetical protein
LLAAGHARLLPGITDGGVEFRNFARRPDTGTRMIEFAQHIETIARELLGKPNEKLSKNGELRFGNHGSLAVDLKKGI